MSNISQSPDEPLGQPEHVDDQTEGEHLSSPDPGHPTDETSPEEGLEGGEHEHPEDLEDTTPDQQSSP